MDLTREDIQDFRIDDQSDIGFCRRKGVSLAKDIGFDDVRAGEIAIMITEMVSNVIKHGGGKGRFMMCRISTNSSRKGIEIWCCDFGKGLRNPALAIRDGYSEKQSLGVGLGAIRRLSDELEINPEKDPEYLPDKTEYGYCLRSRKWVPEKSKTVSNKFLKMGAVSRPKPGENLNGDDYLFHNIDAHSSIAAVIDGLGHGKEAHIASSLAKEYILRHPEKKPDMMLRGVHEAIRGTRGITIGMLKIDCADNKLWFSGIGNIEGDILKDKQKNNLLSFGGIVGHNIRTPRLFEFDFEPGNLVYLYSDGITSRWSHEDVNWKENPQKNAEYIFNKYSRINDDATILIIRYTA